MGRGSIGKRVRSRAWTLALGLAPVGLLLAGLGAVGPATAAPLDIVKALRGSQANLFDLSLARLEAEVGSVAQANGFSAFVNYQDGEIWIHAVSRAQTQTSDDCKGMLDTLKSAAGVDPATGQPNQPASAFAALFEYPEIDSFKIDQTYAETVDSMIVLMGSFDRFSESMSCTTKLLSGEVKTTEPPNPLAGAWTIAEALAAPWADPAEAKSDWAAALVGRTVTFGKERIEGPGEFACAKASVAPSIFPPEALFQGNLPPANPAAEAKALGLPASDIDGAEVSCAEGLSSYHFRDPTTALVALNNVIFVLRRQH
jgi:hypothetical protein